jgi:hypothetical protein
MGRRDIGKHETKKPKKDAKKTIIGTGVEPPPQVEVIKRKRKEQEEF